MAIAVPSWGASVTLDVVPVRTKRDRESFLRLPWRLYRDDPAWVPNLLLLQRDAINPKRNPFFHHGEAELFLALRDGEPAGRISAQIDRRHNRQHGERTGFFGFFESEDDASVAGALLGAAEGWLRDRDMECLRGPFSFSITEEVGMLVDGFETPPMIQMAHGRPYYPSLIEGAGYRKAMDFFAYRWDVSEPPARMMEAVEATRAVPGLRLRTIQGVTSAALGLKGRLNREVSLLLDIYNEAWVDTWGYVPVDEREARKLASDLALIADRRVVVIAEIDGEPAGMIAGIPNLYEAIRDFKGFIDPWKALKLLWRLKLRGTETGRILLFGVRPKFQRRRDLYGLPFALLHQLYLGSRKGRYKWCEESWILESNKRMNAIMPYWNAYVYKTYRAYEKAL